MPKKIKKIKYPVTGVKKPEALLKKIKSLGFGTTCVSLGQDINGYFIYTHRARSKSYKTAGSIPVSVIKFIESTG